jgi:RNA polymerase sigma-70 factor, ECF subfamily
MEGPPDVTALLERFGSGDPSAADELIPLLYGELRRMASRYLRRERAGHTLQPTALVHEVFLRLLEQKDARWMNRSQFFGVAAQLMRRILVDYARRHYAAKRGGRMAKVPLNEGFALCKEAPDQMLSLDETLTRLANTDPQQARIVELRVFGGLSVEEAGELLSISPATVKREWTMAKAWLAREMARPDAHGSGRVESN